MAISMFDDKVLHKKIKDTCTSPVYLPIYDGIINADCYEKANPKVLWILQEAYSLQGKGGWCFSKLIEKYIEERGFGRAEKTWSMITYITWAIYNSHNGRLPRWNEIPEYDLEGVIEILRKIAFINVKKLPNTKSGSVVARTIDDAYLTNRSILHEQIKTYRPDIIIGGHTLRHFYNDPDFELRESDLIKPNSDVYFACKNKRLYIDAYHPAYRKNEVKRQLYCDQILEIIEQNWFNG